MSPRPNWLPMPRIARLEQVRLADKEAEAKRVRRELFAACNRAAQQLGDEIAGYAVVVWGKDGEMRTSYDAQNGPIRAPLVPTLASDALNRHVAVMLAADYIAERDGETG